MSHATFIRSWIKRSYTRVDDEPRQIIYNCSFWPFLDFHALRKTTDLRTQFEDATCPWTSGKTMLSQSRLVSHSIGFFCTYDSILVHEGKRNIGNQVVMSFFFFFFLIGKKERKKERNIKSILNPKSALRNKCALRVHRPTTLEKKRGGRTRQKASTIGKPMGGTTTCTQTYLLVPHTYRSITPPPRPPLSLLPHCTIRDAYWCL